MRNNSRSRERLACFSSVWRTISRLMRVWRTSTTGVAPAARLARISSMENSSGTSIISSRTRSPFFSAVEYSTRSLASFLYRGSVIISNEQAVFSIQCLLGSKKQLADLIVQAIVRPGEALLALQPSPYSFLFARFRAQQLLSRPAFALGVIGQFKQVLRQIGASELVTS